MGNVIILLLLLTLVPMWGNCQGLNSGLPSLAKSLRGTDSLPKKRKEKPIDPAVLEKKKKVALRCLDGFWSFPLTAQQKVKVLLALQERLPYGDLRFEKVLDGKKACVPFLLNEDIVAYTIAEHTALSPEVILAKRRVMMKRMQLTRNTRPIEIAIIELIDAHEKWLSSKERTPDEETLMAKYVAAPFKAGSTSFSIIDLIQSKAILLDCWVETLCREKLLEYADYLKNHQ